MNNNSCCQRYLYLRGSLCKIIFFIRSDFSPGEVCHLLATDMAIFFNRRCNNNGCLTFIWKHLHMYNQSAYEFKPVVKVLQGRHWLPLYLLCISSTQDFVIAAILAVVEYLPTSFKTKSANHPHLNFPLFSHRKRGD